MVGMREEIPKVPPDIPVICVLRDGIDIRKREASDAETFVDGKGS
jgi:hypothetical protein